MLYEKPVVATRIGVFPEFVQEGITGLLAVPGDAYDLAAKIRRLWEHPELCKTMGKAGRAHALREYSPDLYYTRSMNVFNKARQHLYAA
jgi:glycosyltransferase involved in cell wall biosynthesis